MASVIPENPNNYVAVLQHPMWQTRDGLSDAEHIRLSYQRAHIISQTVQMSIGDIANYSPKFWDFHYHLLICADSAASAILGIHWNLTMGTLAKYATQSPYVYKVLKEMERFDAVGGFMLTELGHGLDAQNIETTATLRADGCFELHTPGPQAVKMMGPTSLHAGMRRYAIVFARPVVHGQVRGVKPFLVKINEIAAMTPGIESRLMPPRAGSHRLDHCRTSFNRVVLGPEALLGCLDMDETAASFEPRADFAMQISRVMSGTLSLSTANVAMMRQSGYIVGRYSQRRMVVGDAKSNRKIPIIQFSTQHGPVVKALAYTAVLDAYAKWTTTMFSQNYRNPEIQAALACIFKATVTHFAQPITNELIDRCGWQGLYSYNQVIENVMAARGNSIAEGDSLVLSIRLVSEMLQNRVQLPEPTDPDSLLARHEAGIWAEVRRLASLEVGASTGTSRSRQQQQQQQEQQQTDSPATYRANNEVFKSLILPQCRPLVYSVGMRMAYETAATATSSQTEALLGGVPRELLLDYFEATCVADHDPSWYVENIPEVSRADMHVRVARATRKLLPYLDVMLGASDGEKWATAKFLDTERWENTVKGWERFGGEGEGDEIPGVVNDYSVGGGFERASRL